MASGAGEKTEQPTEKRLREARRKGQVAKSQDLTSSLLLITVALIFAVAGEWTGSRLLENTRSSIESAGAFRGTLDAPTAFSALLSGVSAMALALAPLLTGLVII